jgi:hypothetical protein
MGMARAIVALLLDLLRVGVLFLRSSESIRAENPQTPVGRYLVVRRPLIRRLRHAGPLCDTALNYALVLHINSFALNPVLKRPF